MIFFIVAIMALPILVGLWVTVRFMIFSSNERKKIERVSTRIKKMEPNEHRLTFSTPLSMDGPPRGPLALPLLTDIATISVRDEDVKFREWEKKYNV